MESKAEGLEAGEDEDAGTDDRADAEPQRQGAALVQTKGPTLEQEEHRERESVFVSTSTGANVKRFPLFS
jgi:hypothetical protein